MRILRVAQKVYPDVKGGGPYHVHAMSRDQAAMGHDVTVLTVRYDDSLPHVEERDGYTVVRYDPAVTLLGNDISPGLAQYLSAAEDFDVMHAHSHLYFATNLAALKRFLGDIPLAITNHGLYSQNAPEWVFDLYLRSIGRWTFNQADVVFCYTDTDKERVREFGVSSRIEVVSNGIDTERFTPNGSESELIESDGPVVLFVGRLVEGKQPTVAIDIVSRLQSKHPELALYICGDGALRGELEDLIAHNELNQSVSLLGQVPYDEMPAIYRTADVLLLPSTAEGLPRTVLEAFASETPVVASNLDHIRETVRNGGKTAPPEKPAAFSEQIDHLLSEPDTREHLAKRGRQLATRTHQWRTTVEATTATLESLLA
ncbi:glycosyltransferase family 4 protein [Natrialba taiwanensis]|uniref:Group 1 glycosyl transferase n=1 Tax=Natrialba taiwanensis DSM 12281 TaxID=1230458 RepID=M0A075_9EURY|nr:glycosyltransferase family 4 protein [Natrialba taiwanensis]ELY90788.1 group 1 glycosyl transferase [Natrialba taiwanensis DSM 12281]